MDLFKATRKLLIEQPFYGIFLLSLNKYFSDKVDTAGVCINGIHTELAINESFWNTLNDDMCAAILMHELLHIALGHLEFWDEQCTNSEILNIAMDMEVNSYIPALQQGNYCYAARLGLPNRKGTKFYYDFLIKQLQSVNDNKSCTFSKQANSNTDENEVTMSPLDDHSIMDAFNSLSAAEQELVVQQINHVLKETSEQVVKQAGNIPGELSERIKILFEKKPQIYNWKKHFRRLLGNSITNEVRLTKMRESKRFPGAMGTRLKRKPDILVGIDTSGSMSENDFQDFIREIEYIYKSGVNITIAECDTKINCVFEYKKNSKEINFSGRGGTDLTEIFNMYKKNKKYSSLVLFTDGYLSTFDLPIARNVIWVITNDGKDDIPYSGIVIKIPKQK